MEEEYIQVEEVENIEEIKLKEQQHGMHLARILGQRERELVTLARELKTLVTQIVACKMDQYEQIPQIDPFYAKYLNEMADGIDEYPLVIPQGSDENREKLLELQRSTSVQQGPLRMLRTQTEISCHLQIAYKNMMETLNQEIFQQMQERADLEDQQLEFDERLKEQRAMIRVLYVQIGNLGEESEAAEIDRKLQIRNLIINYNNAKVFRGAGLQCEEHLHARRFWKYIINIDFQIMKMKQSVPSIFTDYRMNSPLGLQLSPIQLSRRESAFSRNSDNFDFSVKGQYSKMKDMLTRERVALEEQEYASQKYQQIYAETFQQLQDLEAQYLAQRHQLLTNLAESLAVEYPKQQKPLQNIMNVNSFNVSTDMPLKSALKKKDATPKHDDSQDDWKFIQQAKINLQKQKTASEERSPSKVRFLNPKKKFSNTNIKGFLKCRL